MNHQILAFLLLVYAAQAPAGGVYFEIGIGITTDEYSTIYGSTARPDRPSSEPETVFTSPLMKGAIGVEFSDGWSLEIEHISSASDTDDGSGINAIWAIKRVYYK